MDWKTASAALVVVASSLSLAACGGSSDGGTGSAGGSTVASAGGDTAANTATAGGDTAANTAANTASAGGDTAANTAAAGGGDNEAVIDAMATGIANAPGSIITDKEDAKCWATGMVDGIGVERLTEVGLSTGDAGLGAAGLTPEEANVMTDSLFSCVDVKALMGEQFVAQGMTEDVSKCMTDKLPEDDLKALISVSLLGQQPDPAITQSMGTAAAECVTG